MAKYIDAEGIMRACYDSFVKTNNKAYKEIALLVEAVPAADVQEVRHGRWELYDICSVCGAQAEQQTNYCPNCGAKMDEDENYCDDENCEIFQRDLNCERCNK